jgi:hypothetical protein
MLPNRLLLSLAVVQRLTAIDDGYGGTETVDIPAPTIVATDVPCRVASQSTRQKYRQRLRGKDVDVDIQVVFMNYRTDIQERDRLVVDGSFYDVLNIADPGLAHHHLELSVEVIK